MEDHSRLLLAPFWWQDVATYLHVQVLDAQPSTSTGVGTHTATEQLRQYRARKKLEEGPLEQANRAARMRDYRAQRKERGQYDPAKEAERKRQYRARKKLEAQLQQPAVATVEDKHRKEAERKRQYRARKKLEAQLGAASSELPPPRKQVDPAKESERKRKYYLRKKMEKLQQLAASGESPSEAVIVRKYRPRKKTEANLVGGQNESPAGLSEKAQAAQRKRQYRARNKLRVEHGFSVLSGFPAAPLLPMLKEGQANAQTQCTRRLSASFTQAAILSKTRTIGVQT